MTSIAQWECWEAPGINLKLTLDGREFYLLIADDWGNTAADVSIRGARIGSELYGYFTTIALLVTIQLRRGTPIAEVCQRLIGITSAPRGLVTGHPRITQAESFPDLLGLVLFDRYDRPLVELAIAVVQWLAQLGSAR